MNPLYPNDLRDKNGTEIGRELFDEDPDATYWWSLAREDENAFRWKDRRLGINWRATHGYLVALNEVSTPEHSMNFAQKNRIILFDDGGFYYKGVAELYIRCVGISSREEIRDEKDLYQLRIRSDITASIGYGSLLFLRLVAAPAAETNPSIPDPKTLTTLVLTGIEREEVPGMAELALYHFRKKFKGIRFAFWRLPDYHLAPGLDESPEYPDPPALFAVEDAKKREVISFFNRAEESGPIPGFLYFYRVLEFCFDEVIAHKIDNWRRDINMDSNMLKKEIRKLISEREDKWALREVLGQLVRQTDLDAWQNQGIIRYATADDLRDCIYSRRNSIAHGRLGSSWDILFPFGFSSGDSGLHDRYWYNLMGELTRRALNKWIFSDAY